MNSFKLVQHNVKSASFIENNEKEKKKDIEVAVEGGVLIPKDLRKTKFFWKIFVKQQKRTELVRKPNTFSAL